MVGLVTCLEDDPGPGGSVPGLVVCCGAILAVSSSAPVDPLSPSQQQLPGPRGCLVPGGDQGWPLLKEWWLLSLLAGLLAREAQDNQGHLAASTDPHLPPLKDVRALDLHT